MGAVYFSSRASARGIGGIMMSNLARVAFVGLALAGSATAAMAGAEPIPGVDVVVRSHPAGLNVPTVTTDAKGHFSLQVTQAGKYRLTTACHPGIKCPSERTVSVTVSGTELKPDVRGIFAFTVGDRPADVSGTVTTAPASR